MLHLSLLHAIQHTLHPLCSSPRPRPPGPSLARCRILPQSSRALVRLCVRPSVRSSFLPSSSTYGRRFLFHPPQPHPPTQQPDSTTSTYSNSSTAHSARILTAHHRSVLPPQMNGMLQHHRCQRIRQARRRTRSGWPLDGKGNSHLIV